jgi:hypothetical protein
MRSALTTVATFTLIASCWLTVMNVVLRHPGYQWQAVVFALFIVQSALTLAVAAPVPGTWTRGWARSFVTVGAVGLFYAGGAAVAQQAGASAFDPARPGAPHFEGYMLVIGVAFAVQGLLTLIAFFPGRVPAGPQQPL